MNYDQEWYNSLSKPEYCPPKWTFRVVWPILYILMFIAFVIVLTDEFELGNAIAYLLFISQLAVNFYWPVCFFKEKNLRKSFLVSAVLAFLVFLTTMSFFEVTHVAGYLMVPYLLWCFFATLLSFQILELNEW